MAWWPGDNAAGDIVGGSHGALQGGAAYSPGLFGQAFSFANDPTNGGPDGMSILKDGSLNLMGDFSIEAWVNFTVDLPESTVAVVFYNYAGVDYYGMTLRENGEHAEVSFRHANNQMVRAEGTTSLNDGEWHHLVGVRSGNSAVIYVDGILEGSATNPSAGSVNTGDCTYARIGSNHTGPGHCGSAAPSVTENWFNGMIDEVRVYNRALTPGEIGGLIPISAPVTQHGPATSLRLLGTWPNPASPATSIRFANGQSSPVSVDIYDLRGRLIRTLLRNATVEAGVTTAVRWDGRNGSGRMAGSGVYVYRVRAAGETATGTLVTVR